MTTIKCLRMLLVQFTLVSAFHYIPPRQRCFTFLLWRGQCVLAHLISLIICFMSINLQLMPFCAIKILQVVNMSNTDFNDTIIQLSIVFKMYTVFPESFWIIQTLMNRLMIMNWHDKREIPSKIILRDCPLPAFSGRKPILYTLTGLTVLVSCAVFTYKHVFVTWLQITHLVLFWYCLEKLTFDF